MSQVGHDIPKSERSMRAYFEAHHAARRYAPTWFILADFIGSAFAVILAALWLLGVWGIC